MTRARPACSFLLHRLPVLLALCLALPAWGADDAIDAATKLLQKRRYEQAARVLEAAFPGIDPARRAQAQLVLGTVYLRSADLHDALGRTAAAVEPDYFGKLLTSGVEGRSRYARLFLAEALLARGDASEAGRHFDLVRGDPGLDARQRAIASIGLGSVWWARREPARARGLWAGAGGAVEVALARAAAQGRAGDADAKSLRRIADAAAGTTLSSRARRHLIEIYLAAGVPDRALALAREGDLGKAAQLETFKAVKGTAKSIAFYDLALFSDIAQLYRTLAQRQFEQALADPRMAPAAEYHLAETLERLGRGDEALAAAQRFLARPQAPAQYRERAQARQALIEHRQGRVAEAEAAWTAIAERSSDPEVLADIVIDCAEARAACARVLSRAGALADAGDGRRQQRLNFAIGSYHLRRQDAARAIAAMENGRDKSNKNKIEANDPEMLAGLAEAYYRTKQFSEGLEILFEMSSEFPVVRQIQDALQGVYSMEQRSAGDVKIL